MRLDTCEPWDTGDENADWTCGCLTNAVPIAGPLWIAGPYFEPGLVDYHAEPLIGWLSPLTGLPESTPPVSLVGAAAQIESFDPFRQIGGWDDNQLDGIGCDVENRCLRVSLNCSGTGFPGAVQARPSVCGGGILYGHIVPRP